MNGLCFERLDGEAEGKKKRGDKKRLEMREMPDEIVKQRMTS